jgi:hypothetical protein
VRCFLILQRGLRVARLFLTRGSAIELLHLFPGQPHQPSKREGEIEIERREVVSQPRNLLHDAGGELFFDGSRLGFGRREARGLIAGQAALERHDLFRDLIRPQDALDGVHAAHALSIEQLAVSSGGRQRAQEVVVARVPWPRRTRERSAQLRLRSARTPCARGSRRGSPDMNGTRAWLWVCLFSRCLPACDGHRPQVRRLPERRVFIALERDFADSRSWGSLALTTLPARGNTHAEGQHRVFINALPPPGTAPFPVGTLIVKEVHAVEPDQNRLFAMAKRGADFNAQGARG